MPQKDAQKSEAHGTTDDAVTSPANTDRAKPGNPDVPKAEPLDTGPVTPDESDFGGPVRIKTDLVDNVRRPEA